MTKFNQLQDAHIQKLKTMVAPDRVSTGEHGVGIGKQKFMEKEHGSSMQWMKKIKALLDPNGILNPGKIFPE